MIIKLLAVLHDIYKHFLTYSLRTAFLQVTITIGGSYLLSWLFRGILIFSGYPGLSIDNIFSFFSNPVTFALLLIYLVVLAFLVFLEFSFLVEMLRYKDIPIHLGWQRLSTDFRDFLSTIRGPHFLAFLGYLILTIPVLPLFFSSALIEKLYIPSFITGELQKSLNGQVGLIIAYLVIFYLNARLIYTLPLTVTRNKHRFTENLKTSWQMTSGKSIFSLTGIAIITLLISFFGLILASLLLGLAYSRFLGHSNPQLLIQTVLLSLVWGIIFSTNLIIKLASVAYLVLNLEHQDVTDVQASPEHKKSRLIRLFLLNTLIALGAFIYNADKLSKGNPNNVAIIAHRGFVEKAVENTIPALEASKEAGANMVEIDVLMTKDKQFVVGHDDNLKRLAGQSTIVSKSQAKDIIGKTVRQNGHTSHIVSLAEYIKRANQLDIQLMIEVKPTRNNRKAFAKAFTKEIAKLDPNQKHKVMSIDLNVIHDIEKMRPAIQTGHVITFQMGSFATEAVDFYAIEEFSYSNYIAKQAHDHNKRIYIWTINTEEQLESYLQSSADGIITDYPDMARREQNDLITNTDYLSYLSRILNLR
ncbi:glycerophosphodiester phosphodiesterase [Streptococcus hyovaginalis]|uniref:glycerophosphodiester phosphodiesterase n=1 Tax=Streptococcus hyovaginalis TaxID=149015 RepID=UPI0014795B75|nr:glycerophosphodiester phosphodiesterase [Streptococcus hyovaginalis]